MTADALSTALMVMGPEDGLALAETLELSALFLLRSDGEIVERGTRGFMERRVA